jgi:ferredoxin
MTTVSDTRALRHWLRGADGAYLVICCVEHPDPGAWSRVIVGPGSKQAVVQLSTCVGQATPAVLLELVAGGTSGITVALDGCAHPADAEAVVTRAGAFMSALGRPETIGVALGLAGNRKHGAAWPILGESGVPVSRRTLFGRPDGLDLVGPSKHPTVRLVEALRELTGGDGSGTELDGIPTGIPRLTASRCAGSGVCARICPLDALTVTRTVLVEAKTDQDGMAQFQLSFDPARCTDCGQCLQVCPESALDRGDEYVWSSLLASAQTSLRVGLIRRCARCGGPHGRSGDLCGVCAYRAANPFGSTMPPGWPDGPGRALGQTPNG